MKKLSFVLALTAAKLQISAFSTHRSRIAATTRLLSGSDNEAEVTQSRRRDIMLAGSFGVLSSIMGDQVPMAKADSVDSEGVTLYKTPSGLKYIELETGQDDSPSPRYGQVCIFSYKAYIKLPNDKEKQQFDASSGTYVTKHGNSRIIAGLDEGLHTMKPGGLRRIIIPPKLGFVDIGLGPLPRYPWDRYKLSKLLDEMVAQQGGNLVYDVRLVKFFDDEADQGYYDDAELSPEEVEEIQTKLLKNRGVSSQAKEL